MDAVGKWRDRTLICHRRSLLGAGITVGIAAVLPNLARAYVAPNNGPIVLAVSDFTPIAASDGETARNITQLVIADLSRIGWFKLLDSTASGGKAVNSDVVPQFTDWRALNAQGLVTGRIGMAGERLKSETRLWDVAAGMELSGQQYFSPPEDWRKVAHVIADAVCERLTGEASHFAD